MDKYRRSERKAAGIAVMPAPVLAGVSAAALLIAGCAGNRGTEDTADGRLQYEPRTNSVEVTVLERRDFTLELISNGRLSAAARGSMTFRSPGVITGIRVTNGQRVGEGDTLAVQERMEQELAAESARITRDRAELDYLDVLAGLGYPASDTASVPAGTRAMARMRSGYDAAENSLRKAELDLSGTVLRAPFGGKVADITLREHDMSGTEAFCTVIDDSVFDVDFAVLESEYPFMEKGLEVRVTPFSGEPRTLYGKVVSVNPAVDRNGQVSVKARVMNDGSLVDGMNVRIAVGRTVPDMLTVPKEAVLIRDNQEVLFRASGGKAVWTYVNVLLSNGREYAVEANADRGAELSAGDTVIVSGNLNLADGSEITIKE